MVLLLQIKNNDIKRKVGQLKRKPRFILMNVKKISLIALALLIACTMSLTAFASSSKTVTSTGSMSVYLPADTTGDSNAITFNMSSIPAGAVVSKVVVDANSNISTGGQGAILSTRVWVKNNNMSSYVSAPWQMSNKTTVTTGVIGKPASGTWYVYYTGSNVSGLFDGSKTYKNVKLTVHYNY